MIVEVDGQRVDIKHYAAIFVQNLHELGGTANTRDIATRSGLATWQVNEAYKQTEEMGLVEWYGEYDSTSRGPGSDPKLYELTGSGRQVVERGVPGKVIALNKTEAKLPEQELQDLRKWVSRVEGKAIASSQQEVSKRFDELHHKLEDVERAEDVQEVTGDLADLEAYIYEWNEAAEIYLKAIRRALEDQGVELGTYFRAVEQDDQSATV
jgi:DNA-binding MarR family transcriptional regulator